MRLLAILGVATVTLAGAVVAVTPQVAGLVGAHESDHQRITLEPLSERSYVYDRYGNVMATLTSATNRVNVKLDQIAEPLRTTVVAVEDRYFYRHKGVNVRSMLRALSANLESGGVGQGGSTITQQLVKNTLVGNKKDLKRKLREAFLAVELEKELRSKRAILERYLNTIYLGNGAYGVQAASEVYFGKDVKDIGWPEAAMLTALIRSPSDYDPFTNPKTAKDRRHTVLQTLVAQGKLPAAAAKLYDALPLPTKPNLPRPADDYFVEQVKQDLLADSRLGPTPSARYNAVFGGGLRIYTTFDPVWQRAAVQARDETLPANRGDGTFALPPDASGGPQYGTAAISAVDPTTGAVRAILGGPGFSRYKYDLATQGTRQPGSSFKTFVLTQAMEEGYSPQDVVDGRAPCGDVPGYPPNDPPGNFGGSRGSVATIQVQTLKSVNCAYLRLGQAVGLDKVAALARKMGITTPLDPSASSMAIGSIEVHPLEMASAYSVLANDGVRNPAYLIDRVTDTRGGIIFEHKASPQRVVSQESARLVTSVLQANVASGTATRARLANGQPAAGKTGTTQNAADVWFVGYTPRVVASVWIGSPQGRVPLSFGGSEATGGRYSAATWAAFVNKVTTSLPVEAFQAPMPRPGGRCIRMPFQLSCTGASRRGGSTSGNGGPFVPGPVVPSPDGPPVPGVATGPTPGTATTAPGRRPPRPPRPRPPNP